MMHLLEMDYLAKSKEIFAYNWSVGWWKQWEDDVRKRYLTASSLVGSELSEALEGDRKSLPDDHLPHHPMFHVELADTIIRLMDMIGAYCNFVKEDEINGNITIEYADALSDIRFEKMTVPEQLALASSAIFDLRHAPALVKAPSKCLGTVLAIARHNNITNIWEIVEEKIEYNKNRLDHKIENRQDVNGKTY